MIIKKLIPVILIGTVSYSLSANDVFYVQDNTIQIKNNSIQLNKDKSHDTLNIYNNVSQKLLSKKVDTENRNIIMDLPDTYINDSFYFYLKQKNQFIDYKYFNISKNDESFSNFINEIVTFNNTVTGKEEIYQLKAISNNFITLKDLETHKITVKNIDQINEFDFPEYNYKDSNHFANITLDKDFFNLKVKSSYLFHGLEWNPHYSTLIDFENNKGYFNYNIQINNNTDTEFKNIDINLFDEILNINSPNKRPKKVFSNSANFSEDMVAQAKVNDNITESYELGKEVINLKNDNYILEPKKKTTIPYKINTKFSFTPNYLFNFYNIKDDEEKNINPNLYITIKRDKNKDFLFNLPNGQNYIYNYSTNNLIKIINTSETKEPELKFNLGDTKILESNIKKKLISYDNKYINNILEKIAKMNNIDVPLKPRILVSENIISFSKKESFNNDNSKITLNFNNKILKENVNYQKAIDGFYEEISKLKVLKKNDYNNRYQYINIIRELFNVYFEKYTVDNLIINDINNKKRILTIDLRI